MAHQGVECRRCERRPGRRAVLGCGRPPTEDSFEGDTPIHHRTETGEVISPAEAVRRGLPAYHAIGFEHLRVTWECCPLWYYRYLQLEMDGEDVYSFVRRAHSWRRYGQLSDVVEPPYTPALVDLIDWMDRLEEAVAIRGRREDEKAMLERFKAMGLIRGY